MKITLKPQSLIFAPMEGVTTASYRKVIRKLYPLWDILCTDFIRIPSNGLYPIKFLRRHIGEHVLNDINELQHTMVQILTAPQGITIETVKQLQDLGVQWLDLNVGCPSGTVVKHRGGSYWLNHLDDLLILIEKIRTNYRGFFSVKTRLGFETSENFLHMIKSWENVGVDAITVHARTRAQLYSAQANWNFIKEAHQLLKIPVIGNGDLWTRADVTSRINNNMCHSAMIARGALKSPWLAQFNNDLSEKERRIQISKYFQALNDAWDEEGMDESKKIKKIKEFSRYIFEEIEFGAQIKSKILLTSSFKNQMEIINRDLFV